MEGNEEEEGGVKIQNPDGNREGKFPELTGVIRNVVRVPTNNTKKDNWMKLVAPFLLGATHLSSQPAAASKRGRDSERMRVNRIMS